MSHLDQEVFLVLAGESDGGPGTKTRFLRQPLSFTHSSSAIAVALVIVVIVPAIVVVVGVVFFITPIRGALGSSGHNGLHKLTKVGARDDAKLTHNTAMRQAIL